MRNEEENWADAYSSRNSNTDSTKGTTTSALLKKKKEKARANHLERRIIFNENYENVTCAVVGDDGNERHFGSSWDVRKQKSNRSTAECASRAFHPALRVH